MRIQLQLYVKGRSILFNHFINLRTSVNLSISCRKNMFLLENFNKNMFFLHEMDKLTSVLMSIEWWNKGRQPLVSRRLLIQITEFRVNLKQRIFILYFYHFLLKVHSTWSSNKKLILVHVVWVVTPDLPGANSGVPKAVSTRDRHTKTGSSLYWSRAPIHNDVFWQYFVWWASDN